jgi:hypothetical protein
VKGWWDPSIYCFLAAYATLDMEAQLMKAARSDGGSSKQETNALGGPGADPLLKDLGRRMWARAKLLMGLWG